MILILIYYNFLGTKKLYNSYSKSLTIKVIMNNEKLEIMIKNDYN